MNLLKKIYGRIYQKVFYVASCFIKFREPKILEEIKDVEKIIEEKKVQHVLILTTKKVLNTEFYQNLKKGVEEKSTCFEQIYEITEPTTEYIEQKYAEYSDKKIGLIIAIGGGSVLDAAKILSARFANPKQSISKMKGVLKVRRKIVPLICVPTTAGTGSECTVAAVVMDVEKNQKYAVNDPKLIPEYAMFEPELMYTLPSELTAITGMDALTHAVEAWIGSSNTRKTHQAALQAVSLILNNLETSYNEPKNDTARKNMQLGSYKAGVAFTRAYVGYVHAFAHAIGAVTHLRHGFLCAVGLPIVLEKYGKSAEKKLAKLARKTYLVSVDEKDTHQAAQAFINKVKELNNKLGIGNNVYGEIKEENYPELINHIKKEVYPLYPVPKYFEEEEIKEIFALLNNGDK